jgi:DNA-binding transcriptional LysR family regulator
MGEPANFTTHQLHVFCTVARLGSYTRAVEVLHIAQPAISAHVAALQSHLGVRLFEREGRGVRLTEAGVEFLSYAERMLALHECIAQEAAEIVALQRGSVRIAASTTAGIYLVPPLLGIFHHQYPTLRVTLDVANRQTVMRRLLAGDIDLGVLGLMDASDRVRAEPFQTNTLVVVAPPGHPLLRCAAEHGVLSMAEFAEQPLLVRERGSGTRLDTEQAFARAGLTMRISQEFGSTGAIKVGVQAGLGLAVLPLEAIRLHLQTGELVILPVEGFPIRRDWHLVHLAARELSPAAAALRRVLLDPGKGSEAADARVNEVSIIN